MQDDSNVNVHSHGYDIESFLNAVEGKDLAEIISSADREATAAWRRAYRRKNKTHEAMNEMPDRYEQSLEDLIRFLRTALPYRPSKIDAAVFKQFLQLRRKFFDEETAPSPSLPLEPQA